MALASDRTLTCREANEYVYRCFIRSCGEKGENQGGEAGKFKGTVEACDG